MSTQQNEIDSETRIRIQAAINVFFGLTKILRFKKIPKKSEDSNILDVNKTSFNARVENTRVTKNGHFKSQKERYSETCIHDVKM